jgi:peroxiredoxin
MDNNFNMAKAILLSVLLLAGCIGFSQEAPEGLFINSKAKNFKATDQFGSTVELKDLLKKGKVVLVFYRGYWCPYCNRYLKKLEDSLQLIKDKGATLIAVTPEKPESVSKTVEKTKAEYSIIYDEDMKIMKAYEVDYTVPGNTVTRYRNTGINLEEINGENGNSLPIPATYIIDEDSNVTYRFFNPDYKKRPSVKEILDHLK